jgi:hypothetical protein
VELFSYAFFTNGIIIQKLETETIPAKVKWQTENLQVENGQIPGTIYFPSQKGKLTVEIPNADIQLQYDPIMEIHNSEIIQIGDFKFTFRDLSTAGWIFYLTIAWILGEILCFLGEILIGILIFGYKPFHPFKVEKVSPFPSSSWIRTRDFIKTSQGNNALAMEISEVHFVLSRVFSGLIILFPMVICPKNWVIFGELTLLFLILLFVSILSEKVLKLAFVILGVAILGFCVLCLIVLNFNMFLHLTIGVLLLLSFFVSIFYRTHANRLLKAASREER